MPYGLGAWVNLGGQFGVGTPIMRSLIHLASAVLGIDLWKSARTTADLGLSGMSKEELLGYVAGSSTAAAAEAVPRRP